MTDCPLCQSIFTEGYQHIDYHIIICLHCYIIVKGLRKKEQEMANRKLKQYRIIAQEKSRIFLEKGMIKDCFESPLELTQKSDRASIVTQDTEAPLDSVLKQDKNTTTIVLEKCQETVTAFASRMKPTKQKIAESKEVFLEKTQAIKDKYRSIRQEFRVIKAQLPPVNALAREAKQKLGSFLKFF